MCIRLFGTKAQSPVKLSSKIGIDSFGFSFEASPLSERVRKILRGLRIRAKSNLLQKGRGSRANERCFTIVSLFSFFFFSSPPPFLLPCSFNIRNSRVFAKNTRARASFPCRENYISKIHFQSFFLFLTRGHALVLARARVAHDEYLCSYARHTCTDWRWITSVPLFTIFSAIREE